MPYSSIGGFSSLLAQVLFECEEVVNGLALCIECMTSKAYMAFVDFVYMHIVFECTMYLHALQSVYHTHRISVSPRHLLYTV